MYEYLLGIFLAILAALVFSVGAILQKKGVENMAEIKFENIFDSVKVLFSNKIWVIGLILAIGGGVPYALAINYAGVALSQPLMGIGMLFVALFAVLYLGETLRMTEKIGITTLIIAPIFLSLGEVTNTAVSITDPSFHFRFIVFYVLCFTGIGLSFLFYWKSDKFVSENMALNSGIFFGAGALSAQLAILAISPFLSGPLSYSWNPFFIEFRPQSDWFIGAFGLIILLLGNSVGTFVVQIAFQKGKAAIVVPIQSTGNLLLPVVGGVLIFNQTIGNMIFFSIGIGLMLFGTVLLARLQAEAQG
ncbi:MAG: DMT family transporter [Candidatus Helarchaeota archaeon]